MRFSKVCTVGVVKFVVFNFRASIYTNFPSYGRSTWELFGILFSFSNVAVSQFLPVMDGIVGGISEPFSFLASQYTDSFSVGPVFSGAAVSFSTKEL